MRNGILSAGNWVVDIVKIIDSWPEEGMLCNIISEQISGGGAPFNVLSDLSKMDDSLPLYGAGLIGTDDYSKFLRQKLDELKIDTEYLYDTSDNSTSYTDVMTAKDTGNRTFFHRKGSNSLLDIKHFEDIKCNAKIFHLGYLLLLDKLDSVHADYGTRAALLLKNMQDLGFKTSVDVVSVKNNRTQEIVNASLKYVDYLIINEVEAGIVTDLEIRENNDINKDNLYLAAKSLIEKGVNELVILHFPEGGYAMNKNGDEFFVASKNVESKDIKGTVGAGDAFCAGMLYALHQEKSIKESLKIANTSAWFNLQDETATGGAVSFKKIEEEINKK